jgi:hypothetical protein
MKILAPATAPVASRFHERSFLCCSASILPSVPFLSVDQIVVVGHTGKVISLRHERKGPFLD